MYLSYSRPLTSRIEEELGDKAKFAGKDFRHPKIN